MALAERSTPCPSCDTPMPAHGALADLCPECLLQHARGAAPRAAAADRALPSVDELQARIPQLQILHAIGRGGMGAVYKALQRDLDRFVAVKVLRPDLAGEPVLADRFVREARNLARLDHPHIVKIHDFGRSDDLVWLVMEHVDGSTVRELIDARLLSTDDALEVFPGICEALQFAHEHGVVHRDVKPGNILIDRDGRAKVADFGLSKMLRGDDEPHLTRSEQAMGTPNYMAPEQLRRTRDVDHRADIFSLGVLLFEMLTGDVPVGRFDPPSERCDIDPRLDAIVMRALDRDPAARYPDARAFAQDVIAVRDSSPSTNEREATPRTEPTRAPAPLPLLPFTVSGEFHQAKGMLTVDDEFLRIEFRMVWGGMFPLGTHTIRVPLENIQSAEYTTGLFRNKLRILPRSMTPFEGLPCRDYDIRFKIRRNDSEAALRITEAIRSRHA